MYKANNYNKFNGFSITEVLIIIGIVAIIASTGIPKLNRSLNSDVISVATTAGEFDSSVRLARAQWFSNGQKGPGRIKGFADGHVWSSERGWPVTHRALEAPADINDTHCANVWNAIMRSSDAPRASAENDARWRARGKSQEGVCEYNAKIGSQQHTITYSTQSGKVSYR